MDIISVIEVIKRKFAENGSRADIPLLKGGAFKASLADEGVVVDNLGNQPFLHWAAFQEAVCILIRNGGRAKRGDAMQSKLGEPGLPIDSVEGHVALRVRHSLKELVHLVYKYQPKSEYTQLVLYVETLYPRASSHTPRVKYLALHFMVHLICPQLLLLM